MSMGHIRIGSRGSDLALWQANHIKKQLEEQGHTVDITIIQTKGDAIQNLSFDKIEGKGFFTKEIEQALLEKSIDLAVHSHKDLETQPPKGLVISAVSEREDPADVLLIRKDKVQLSEKWGLCKEAIVGTSSARRKALMRQFRPDVELCDLRGNVPTRIQKLRENKYDAILLAKAGLDRLELDISDFHQVRLDPKSFVPAPAQGVLALQIRQEDTQLDSYLKAIHHADVQERIYKERKVLSLMNGGCQLPLGVFCDPEGEVHVSYASSWEKGSRTFQFTHATPEEIVVELNRK
jgi:hydroxymethylbilane synthase